MTTLQTSTPPLRTIGVTGRKRFVAGGRSAADGPTQGPMVTPFARALAVLEVFGLCDRWLGTREIGTRSGLPDTTVKRIAQSLVVLGYLHHDIAAHRYRLAAAVLALGYGAIANSDIQRVARARMQAFADSNQVEVQLSTRVRLDVIVLEACCDVHASTPWRPHVGERVVIGSSPMGWALLATLPEAERFYLMENLERRMPREWAQWRRRCMEGISQVHERGFCASFGDGVRGPVVAAVPVLVENHAPSVLACIATGTRMTRARIERDLAPGLLAKAAEIRQAVPIGASA
jgi:DNA-binding IclR family transcriptional regulator